MTTHAHSPHPEITLGMTSSGRVFQSFRRWPLVPTRDLVWLRHAFEQCAGADGSRPVQPTSPVQSNPARDLLCLVGAELARRQHDYSPESGKDHLKPQ